MVEDVLDISRIESGRIIINYEPVNLKQVLDGLYSNLDTQAGEKSSAFEVDVPDDFPPVRADEKRLTKVLFNLAGNAIKFTEAGKIIISARSLKEDRQRVVISVSDTGIGIPEEYLSRIFDRFERLDQSGKKVGAGLGLAITKKTEALRIMAGESPDLMLLDVMMPGTNGFEVCRQIRPRGTAGPHPQGTAHCRRKTKGYNRQPYRAL